MFKCFCGHVFSFLRKTRAPATEALWLDGHEIIANNVTSLVDFQLIYTSVYHGFGLTTLMEQLYKYARAMLLENSRKIAHIRSNP